jgi:hypothetical protein
MLNYKPKHYIKYWKVEQDEHQKDVIKLITHEMRELTLVDHYVFLWKMVDGFRTIAEMIDVFVELYPENTREEITKVVCSSLEEMHQGELIIINWNPFS